MEIKILQVFYGKDGLPYKDKDRQVHFPIAGTGFLGASNTTKIKFYYDELDNLDETSWVAVSKLPNGKVGSRVLESYLDEELNEHYALLELDNYYTQYKGDVFISLQGYQGGVDFDYDEENSQYEIHGTPTIAATGSIKFTINYANQFVGSGETDNINFQRILAALGTKLGMRAYSEHVEELPSDGSPDVFYVVNDDPNNPNLANIYVWNGNTRHYIWVGDNTLDLGEYYTKSQGEQFENNIDNRVTSVENELSSVAQGSPKGVYATLADLQAAYPTGTTGIYVVSADGHWYYWNGSAWDDGGLYLTSGYDTELYNELIGKELFNQSAVIQGKAWSKGSHAVVDSASTYGSIQMEVKPGTIIKTSGFSNTLVNYGCAFLRGTAPYLISEFSTIDGQTFVVPEGAKYFYASFEMADINNISFLERLNNNLDINQFKNIGILFSQKGTTNNTILFTKNDVDTDEVVYYSLTAKTGTNGYIELLDENNTRLAIYGKTSVGATENHYEGYFQIPSGFDHCILGSGLDVDIHYILNKVAKNLIQNNNGSNQKDVVIIGDSWSDTNPDHTIYTKWPVYLKKWKNDYIIHNYAQNGSQVYGSDNYGVNGTHGGQMATAENDTSFNHDNCSLVIIEGGLNDYSHHTTVENLVSGFVSLINRAHTAFPNAKVICVLNNMILTCKNLWFYMQTAKKEIKIQTGCPAYTTFGWVPASNYVSDQMHINDDGYKCFASNMIAIVNGGSPTFISNKATKSGTSTGGASVSLTVLESFTEDALTRVLSVSISGATGNGFTNLHFAYNDGVLCSIPFYSFPDKQVTGGNIADMEKCMVRGYSDNDSYSDFAVQVAHKNADGTYIGEQVLTTNTDL